MSQQLLDYLTAIKTQIIDIASQKGMNASGKTLSSMEITPTEKGYDLLASPNIYFMEHGRGPTHPGTPAGNPKLTEVIQNWLDAKGLDANPYAIAHAIHKNATRLYRSGGNSGILSVPLNLDRLDQVFDEISATYLNDIKTEVFAPMRDG